MSLRLLFKKAGIPIMLGAFLVAVLIGCGVMKLGVPAIIGDSLRRIGMNGLLVLSMVPSIKSGTGPNFALPVGITSGLFSLVVCMEFDLMGVTLLIASIALTIVVGGLIGFGYGKLLNAVKGAEMTIATYTGFSITALFSIVWLAVPFKNTKMTWLLGSGLRETIQLNNYNADGILSNLWSFSIGSVTVPTGMLLFLLLCCLLMSLFFKTKAGIAIYAGGINPRFAEAAGLDVNRGRVLANVISTIVAGIGIIIYAQGYGFAQLYQGPMLMAFPAVAAVLIGGATASTANCINVLVGVTLFQGIMTCAMPLANALLPGTDLSDTLRMIIQNGVILFALTQVKGGGR